MKFFECDNLEQIANKTVEKIKNGIIGLSGGNTYKSLFLLWAKLKPEISDKTIFLPVDERVVDFDSKDSNWFNAYEYFFKPLGLESQKKHNFTDAQKYEEFLLKLFNKKFPVFDTIFLGVGDDGHTASLFPGCECLNNNVDSLVLTTVSPKEPKKRITLSPKVITSAKNLIVIVSGNGKKKILERMKNNDNNLPVVKILNKRPDCIVYVDKNIN